MQRPYTVIRSTTFLIVPRQDYTGLLTDRTTLRTAAITLADGVKTQFSYEQHFSTGTSDAANQEPGPSSGLIIGLSVALPLLFIMISALVYFVFRRRRRRMQAARARESQRSSTSKTNKQSPNSSTNSSWRSSDSSSPRYPRSASPPPPTIHLSPVPEARGRAKLVTITSNRPALLDRIPNRSDPGTPLAELESPGSITDGGDRLTTMSTLFNNRRCTLPPLQNIHIERANTRRSSVQMPFTPNSIQSRPHSPDMVSAMAASLQSSPLVVPRPRSSSFNSGPLSPTHYLPPQSRSPSNLSRGSLLSAPSKTPPIASMSTGGSSSSGTSSTPLQSSSTSGHFSYGYQSEYPEVSGPPQPPIPLGIDNRQKEFRLLAEEERLIRERVRATEELIRLKNEEARITPTHPTRRRRRQGGKPKPMKTSLHRLQERLQMASGAIALITRAGQRGAPTQ
ncbi:hypothetical protein BZA05DRAFT_383174 [Tricharina praecox]|uniref:uncharacterized protein n=1 Tax=Tricharina praecox TaxID=43433 RepID=UPI00221EFA3C|nr:uncharacterized protein BZA05DRAFT_383174 [Tricharina praecox]KAI5859034.1 hypothetical protein BZA05DRAFT_383174 [Tricharina praecox]